MASDLKAFIAETRLVDSHEHLRSEEAWVERGPDVLSDLFSHYILGDLASAGASEEAIKRVADAGDPDVAGRFAGIVEAWRRVQFTGYGEALRLTAKAVYGLEEITAEGLMGAQETLSRLRRPGGRLRLLRDVAKLDHVQIDDFTWACRPDPESRDFFLYDMSWASLANAAISVKLIANETGIEVRNLESLDEAMEAIAEKYAPLAIAVKTQHAYNRTLRWEEREKSAVEAALGRLLTGKANTEDKLAVGDWCLARGVELAIRYDLPIKIHTGYYAGHSHMPMERIHPAHLCGLLMRYPKARFVLMHLGYPYTGETLALAKHFPNVWADLCWTWSIDARACVEFLRRFIHTAPANKLFLFGGDTFWPTNSVAYALQARRGLTVALEAEVRDGTLAEKDAIDLAGRFMRHNQEDCFDLNGTRENIARAAAVEETAE